MLEGIGHKYCGMSAENQNCDASSNGHSDMNCVIDFWIPLMWSWDSSFSIVTDYWLDSQGSFPANKVTRE
jgi:hypothetical protein